MVQWRKGLPLKQDDLSSDPQHLCIKAECSYLPITPEGVTQRQEDYWDSRLDKYIQWNGYPFRQEAGHLYHPRFLKVPILSIQQHYFWKDYSFFPLSSLAPLSNFILLCLQLYFQTLHSASWCQGLSLCQSCILLLAYVFLCRCCLSS